MSRYGFLGDEGKVYLQCCHLCERGNYGIAVSTDECAWCGYKGKEEDVKW